VCSCLSSCLPVDSFSPVERSSSCRRRSFVRWFFWSDFRSCLRRLRFTRCLFTHFFVLALAKRVLFPLGQSHVESSLAILASRSSPVAQVSPPPGQRLAGGFSHRPVSVKPGSCLSRRILLYSIPFCRSAMVVLSQGGLQFQR
jgi:hypothetical protein